MRQMKNTVLLVDDDLTLLTGLRRRLRHADFEIETAASGHEAIAMIEQEDIDLIVADQRMAGMEGTELLAWVLEYDPDIIRIMLTGHSDVDISIRAINEGRVYYYLDKPVCTSELEHVILQGLEKRRLKRENQQLLTRISEQLDQLNHANLELERSNRELEQFSSVVAHDINSPLGTIVTSCELVLELNEDMLDSTSKDLLSGIDSTARRLVGLVRSVLNYACIDQGDIELRTVHLNHTVKHVRENLHALFLESGATLDVDPLPIIQGDEHLLTQLFQNLIGNAIKYRGEKEPCISISAEKVPEGWQIAVGDNGEGIAEEEQGRVFEAFQQVDSERPGVGLGLSTCRKIMERHSGHIEFTSEPGAGTTFVLSFSDLVKPGESDSHSEIPVEVAV